MKLLLPGEHGAYGQMLFPLVTSVIVAGPDPASLLLAAAVIAGFLAHEPFMLLLGFRGVRAARDAHRDAVAGLTIFGTLLVICGLWGVAVMPHAARWSVIVPLVPALFLLSEAASGREKAWPAEVAVAGALSLTSIPICMAAGAPFGVGAMIAVAFLVNFVLATLGIRVIILRVRAGGNLRAASATRNAVFALAVIAAVAGVAAVGGRWAPVPAVAALVPGLVSAVLVAWQAPPPSRLRAVGWRLVGMSTLIALMLIVSFRILR